MTNRNEALSGNSGRCVHRLVEDQAVVRPDAIAVRTPHCAITYQQLNQRSAALAAELKGRGVGPDVVVGICMKSSIAMVVAALGVLKAGGAYLPLDPRLPEQRLSFILNDAEVAVLLTTADVTVADTTRVLEMEADGTVTRTSTPPVESADPVSFRNLAYVIYTSGSTGEPKGVEIEHQNLLNLIDWHHRTFSITADDRASQVAGPGFDAAVWEIWPYLTAGASIHIPAEDVRVDPEKLRDWLVREQITVGFMPTAIAERLMVLPWPADTQLRTLLTGADTLHRFPPAGLPFAVVNNYGPTECTVVATSGTVHPQADQTERPTIGSAISNTRIYILGPDLKPVAMDVPGELYIAGAGVARGYRNRPDMTAAKFVRDPFINDTAARMYKTGDLARMRPDGQIAFLGRIDDQIKIRGYRVEPDEISTALNRHPEISQSAIAVRMLSETEQRLIAYVVPAQNAQISRSEIQTFLQGALPDYMIPSTFVRLAALPLTPNGKIDREHLPEPDAENTITDGEFEAPRSAVEEQVTALLSELLETEQLGVRDNFFHLGGHSLLGAQVITRVRDEFDVELSLRTLFDNPTVEGISAEIERLILQKLDANENDAALAIPDELSTSAA